MLLAPSAARFAAWTLVVTILFASSQAGAAEPARTPKTAILRIPDVEMHQVGAVQGTFVNGQGKPVEGAKVALRQRGKVVATTDTNKGGKFQFQNLRGGTYEIATVRGNAAFRLWAPKTAPPSARTGVLIVAQEGTVRGQDVEGFTFFDPYAPGYQVLTLGLGAVGTGFGIYSISEIDSLKSDIRVLQAGS